MKKFECIGRLCKDFEMNFLPDGTAITRNSLAIDEKRNGVKKTEFVKVSFFGKSAECVMRYTGKGKMIYVSGNVKAEAWENRQTKQIQSQLSVTVLDFMILEWNKKEATEPEERDSYSGAETYSESKKSQSYSGGVDCTDPEVPF